MLLCNIFGCFFVLFIMNFSSEVPELSIVNCHII